MSIASHARALLPHYGEEITMRSLLSAAMLLLCPALCLAQASVASSCLADPDAPAAAPIVSDAMASQFAAIRQCIADEDGDCAEDTLDAIDDDELSDDELAVYWLASGDMENLQGSSRRARREYRRVVGQRDGNRQLVVAAIEQTAILYIEDDNYDNAADALGDVQCGEWTPALVYLRARAHFGEAEFSDAEATARLAVDAQEASGERVPSLRRRLASRTSPVRTASSHQSALPVAAAASASAAIVVQHSNVGSISARGTV